MRIVYDYQIFSIRQYGGISRYFVELATHIGRLPDVDARVVAPLMCSRFLAERRGQMAVTGVDLSRVPGLPLRVVQGVNRVLFPAAAALARPDIVHETYYAPQRTAPRSAKIVTTIHDTIPERLPQHFPWVEEHRTKIRKALKRADWVICVSESTRSDLLALYEVAPEKVSVVRLGTQMEPTADGPEEMDGPYFLHVGARYAYKNFNALLQAFSASGLHRTHRLVAFSQQPLTVEEHEAIKRLGIAADRVLTVSGDDRRLARYYAGATALVFPSLYEGFGIPLVEAMRCGCPVITSNTSSLPEVAGNAAIYCDPAAPESFAAAMEKVAFSAELRGDLIAKGRERAQLFTWEKCAAETYAVYRNVLGPFHTT